MASRRVRQSVADRSDPLTRRAGAHLPRVGSEGRRSRVPQGARSSSQRRWSQRQRPSATVREGHARTSQGKHDPRLCPPPRGVGYARLKRRTDLQDAGRELDTTEVASSRSSIFSQEEMAPLREGTVERFWSLGSTDSRAREQRAGRSWRSVKEPTAGAEGTTRGGRDGVTAREGSTSADMKRGRAEGQHPGRRETPSGPPARLWTGTRPGSRTEDARVMNPSKRTRANSNVHPEGPSGANRAGTPRLP